jgi:hypothetical protein
MAGYQALPDFRAPRRWRLSAGGVTFPPLPVGGNALDVEIDAILVTLSDEQRPEPRYFPDNYVAWNEFFRRS